MQKKKDNHEFEETPSGKAWQPPEVEVLMVDQTELSSVVATDGVAFAS